MAKKRDDKLSQLITEVEKVAKRLRTDIRNAARRSGVERRLRSTARDLRRRAVKAAEQVEKYAHRIRVGLEGAPRA